MRVKELTNGISAENQATLERLRDYARNAEDDEALDFLENFGAGAPPFTVEPEGSVFDVLGFEW